MPMANRLSWHSAINQAIESLEILSALAVPPSQWKPFVTASANNNKNNNDNNDNNNDNRPSANAEVKNSQGIK